ncbi:MAG: hypothetical protein NVSMB32_09100 [Actinomycetota bacterium]
MGVVAALAALSAGAVFSAPGDSTGTPLLGSQPDVPVTRAAAAVSPAPSSTPGTAPGPPTRGRPPQFVVLSFDGSGSVDLMKHWREVAARDKAHFTFFLSGVYLLTHATANAYHPPRHAVGASDIGQVPAPAGTDANHDLLQLLQQLGAAHLEGHEIGTHFNGHFCAPGANSGGTWDAAAWAAELDQFSDLLSNVNQNNLLFPALDLPFGPADVVGDRTPCLEGKFKLLYPLLAQRGFRYDASQSALEGRWPQRQDGIWSFPLASIPLAGRGVNVLSMDYNLYYNQTHAKDVPAALEPSIEDQAYKTFMGYFTRAYNSTRAPVVMGAHMTNWNNSAYEKAFTRVIDDTCTRPEVRCVSFKELAQWLDARTPAELAALYVGSPTAVDSSPAPMGMGPVEQ